MSFNKLYFLKMNSKFENYALISLSALWAALVCLFVYFDFARGDGQTAGYAKFALIVVCLLISATAARKNGDYLLIAAMFLTVVSDLFIVIIGNNPVGVSVFCAAHLAHFVRNTKRPKLSGVFIIYIAISAGIYFISRDILISLSVLYACCLLSNFVSSFFAVKRKYLTVFGMILFLLCDICVLLYNLPDFASYGGAAGISGVAYLMIWIFYAPSQLLLALSGSNEPRAAGNGMGG